MLYCRCMRDLGDLNEACVLLVDTCVPGWRVLYTGPSFENVTGVPRSRAMGAAVNDLMRHACGDPRVVWEGVEREVAAGKAFVTPRVSTCCLLCRYIYIHIYTPHCAGCAASTAALPPAVCPCSALSQRSVTRATYYN